MIKLEQFSFGYKKEHLFKDANLSLAPGNIYGLLGLNGAGKSTLLQLMAGLLTTQEGNIDVLGCDPARRSPKLLSDIFLLSENLVLPNVTGREYTSIYAPFYNNFDHEHMQRCLTEFEIPTEKKLPKLSHGQQKKFMLSFGLSCKTALLFLDEPTNGLDIPSKGLFRKLVAESLDEEQLFVVSTHQVQDVESLIDAILILHQGKILFNQQVGTVTDNLRMSYSKTPPADNSTLLYSESVVGGYATVSKDSNAGDGKLDLELLFKAVIANPDAYRHIFHNQEAA